MAKHLRVVGLVQGVGYRASFAETAMALGLIGWVRNRRDGSVEACVYGDVAAVEVIIVWAKRGPPSARVSNVVVEDATEPAPLDGKFNIFPTR